MQWVRKLLFWAHLIVGVTAGAAVFLMSVTGVLLTYQRQVVAWADTRAYEVSAPAGAARLPAAQLVARVQQAEGGTPTTLVVRRRPAAPAEVAYGREKTVFVDPYTGQVLGHGSKGVRRFFSVVTDWHRWLGRSGESRAWGKGILDAANLGFLFLVLSGFYLWWPRRWTRAALRHVLWYRRGLRPRARNFNWHNVTGFWGLVPLVVVVASGVVISYPWASNAVYRIYGETPPQRSGPPGEGLGAQGRAGRNAGRSQGGREGGEARGERGRGRPGSEAARGAEPSRGGIALGGVDAAWARAQGQVADWRSIRLQLPTSAEAPLTFTVDRGTGGQPQKQGELKVDRASGRAEWKPFAKRTPGARLRSILRFAHTGEVLGLTGQTIAGLASAGAALLVWTGMALAWRRYRAWLGRRRDPGIARRVQGSPPARVDAAPQDAMR